MEVIKKEIDGHTFEIRYSGSGSIDPWTGDYARENNISLIGTSDVVSFILVDGDNIYRSRRSLVNFITSDFDNYESAMEWIKEHTKYTGSLINSLNYLNKLKKQTNNDGGRNAYNGPKL